MPIDLGTRILIVDDMPAMRLILRGMLEDAGFTKVLEAESGDEAWGLIQNLSKDKQQSIELIIADWNMPGLSGIDLLRAVRGFNVTRTIPFLMVTSLGNESATTEAIRAGVTDYFVKPFTPEQFIKKITEILLNRVGL